MDHSSNINTSEQEWWNNIPASRKTEIRDSQNATVAGTTRTNRHVSKGCGLVVFAIIIRMFCFLIGIVEIGCGGWVLYQVANNIVLLPILSHVAQGGFLILAGFLTVLAESRTKRTMEGCLNTYIILSNYLARAVFYIVIGGVTFPMNFQIIYLGKYGSSKILSGLIVAGGLMNLLYAPFNFRYQRKKKMALHTIVTLPEETVGSDQPSQMPFLPPKPAVESDIYKEQKPPTYSDVVREPISGADV